MSKKTKVCVQNEIWQVFAGASSDKAIYIEKDMNYVLGHAAEIDEKSIQPNVHKCIELIKEQMLEQEVNITNALEEMSTKGSSQTELKKTVLAHGFNGISTITDGFNSIELVVAGKSLSVMKETKGQVELNTREILNKLKEEMHQLLSELQQTIKEIADEQKLKIQEEPLKEEL